MSSKNKERHPIDFKRSQGYEYQTCSQLLQLQMLKMRGINNSDIYEKDLQLYKQLGTEKSIIKRYDESVEQLLFGIINTDQYNYQGFMLGEKKEGVGLITQGNRKAFEGIYIDDTIDDFGVIVLHPLTKAKKSLNLTDFRNFKDVEPNGVAYRGQLRKGNINGVGEMKFKAGKQTFYYVGGFKDNKFHGRGQIEYQKEINFGIWNNGLQENTK